MGVARAVFVFPGDTSDRATVTASSTSGALAAKYVKDSRLGRVWRSTGDTNENLVFDMGEAVTLDCLVIAGHSLTVGATLEIRASTDNFSGSDVSIMAEEDAYEGLWGYGEGGYGEHGYGGFLLTGEIPDWNPIILKEFTEATYRYWKVIIKDPDSAGGYIQIGRCCFEHTFEPNRSYVHGFSHGVLDPSITGWNFGGSPFSAVTAKGEVISGLQFLTTIDDYYHEWLAKALNVGTVEDFFMFMDEQTDGPTYAQIMRYYGRFVRTPVIQRTNGVLNLVGFDFRRSR